MFFIILFVFLFYTVKKTFCDYFNYPDVKSMFIQAENLHKRQLIPTCCLVNNILLVSDLFFFEKVRQIAALFLF